MGITNSGQLQELFLAGGLGFLLGAFYDVFRVIRLMMRPSARVIFFQDLLYFTLSSVITFLFALAVTGGELRFYLFLGLVTGFMAYYFTVGRAVMRCAKAGDRCDSVALEDAVESDFFPISPALEADKTPSCRLGTAFGQNRAPNIRFLQKNRQKYQKGLATAPIRIV